MNYIKELYIDENLKNPDEVLSAIQRKSPIFNVYLICVDKLSHNMALIMSLREAFAERNANRDMTLIGVAYGRRGGYELFKRIVEQYLEKGFDISDFKNKILQ